MTRALLDREFLFVAGKGGVGRTTVSAALALAAASLGKKVLLAMCNAPDRLSPMLDVPAIGPEIQSVLPGLDAVNMTPESALREYGRMHLRVGAVYRAIFENRLVMSFLQGTPGLESWSLLGKAYYHAQELVDGAPRYDLVIVDGPATGHALDMLRTPRTFREMVPPGVMRREADRAWELFSDAERSAFALVSLPEDMPVNETLELAGTLGNELALPVGAVILNRCRGATFTDEEQVLLEPGARAWPAGVEPLVESARHRVRYQNLERDAVRRLGEGIGAPLLCLPEQLTSELGKAEIDSLAAVVRQSEIE
jgi:anion-transporting  ArsA/GET3 family ATPase